MTVQELIDQLNKVEDKNKNAMVDGKHIIVVKDFGYFVVITAAK